MILLLVGISHYIVRLEILFDNSMEKSNTIRLFNDLEGHCQILNAVKYPFNISICRF